MFGVNLDLEQRKILIFLPLSPMEYGNLSASALIDHEALSWRSQFIDNIFFYQRDAPLK